MKQRLLIVLVVIFLFITTQITSAIAIDYPAINAPTGRGATFVIASVNATIEEKSQADYRCDGVADEVQIQTAINSLPIYGGSILFSSGTFYIGSTINITKANNGVILRGQGQGEFDQAGLEAIGTRLLATSNITVLRYGNTGALGLVNDITIRDMFIDGNVASPIGVNGIEFVNAIDIWLSNLTIRNFTNAGILGDPVVRGDYVAGIYADKVVSTQVKFVPQVNGMGILWDIKFDQSWVNLLYLGDSTHAFAEFTDIKFSNSWHEHIEVYGLTGYYLRPQIQFLNTTVESSTNATMVRIQNVANGRINGMTIDHIGNLVTDKYGLDLVNVEDFTVTNIQIDGKVNNSLSSLYNGIYLQTCKRVNIIGGNIFNTSQAGISMFGTKDSLIDGITFNNVGQGGWGGNREAINVYGDSSHVSSYNKFTNLRIRDTAINKIIWGLVFDIYSHNNTVEGNLFSGAITSQVLDNGLDNIFYRNQGYITENSGSANITNSNNSVIVNHGLASTPAWVGLSSSHNETGWLSWTANTTSINITSSYNVTADRIVYWRATIGAGN